MQKKINLPIKKISLIIIFLVFGLFATAKLGHTYYIEGPGGGSDSGGSPDFDYKRDYWEPDVYENPSFTLNSHTNETFKSLVTAINDSLIGPSNPEYLSQNNGGASGVVAGLINSLYSTPPASSVEYFADLGSNIGFVKPAYAQGIGFQGLKPFLDLWKIFRNITYLFFTIIFVIIGFAIMFRVKLNPQTTASLQNTLPKIVIAMILVTFSYAIAGLLIDSVYILISLVFSLFKGNLGPTASHITNINALLSENVFSFSDTILKRGDVAATVSESFGDIVTNLLTSVSSGLSFFGGGAAILAKFVITIAMVFSLFKLFFVLLMSYISVIFAVIFSPIILALEAIPGQSGLKMWLKMIFSNLIVFPATATMFIIGGALVNIPTDSGQHGWVAPFLGQGWGTSIAPLIGLAVILVTPSIVDEIKKAVGAASMGEVGAQAMQPIGSAWRTITAPVTKPVGWATEGLTKAGQGKLGKVAFPDR